MQLEDRTLKGALQSVQLLNRMQDYNGHGRDALYAFALDELLCRRTGQGGPAVCHLWRHPSAFIMGLRDSRLPQAQVGMQWLETQGWQTAVRHSGGAAVPLDLGIVNLSLILPMEASPTTDYRQDFETMYRLIAEAVREQCRNASIMEAGRVEKGEIAGAYCPGDFDLSIDGFKFCGIAQRRQSHAFIVQAFIVAEGSGRDRARLVRSFYELAASDADSEQYPLVEPDSTRSLDELLSANAGGAAGFAEAVKRIVRGYQALDGQKQAAEGIEMPSQADIVRMMESLRSRYTIQQ